MHAVILGGNSDIGKELAKRLLRDGWRLAITHRGTKPELGDSVDYVYHDIRITDYPGISSDFDLLICCVGTLEPIGKLVDVNPWGPQVSMLVNVFDPLRHIAGIMRFARPNASIVFFGGMNTNSAHPNFFAYSLASIARIKAMELLDAELPNCRCFALGPGYIPTKMHAQIRAAGLEPVATLKGSSHNDLYECLMWAHSQPKAVIGGRNIAVHTDDWRNPEFAKMLAENPNTYKLRRLT